jgi:beta-lactam-binding protein with PASTA domain
MASESERVAADDDTVVVEPNERAQADEVTQTGDQWPVSDLYYVEPDDASPEHAESEAPDAGDEAGLLVAAAAAEASTRRRFPPDLGIGTLLALLGVAAVLVLGAVVLGLDGDDPATGAQPTEPARTTPTETSPPPAATTKVEAADVEGMTVAEATEALEAQGLRVRVTRSPSERPRGTVLSQAPSAGSEVARGTVVALVVSVGPLEQPQTPARVDVPGVVGLSASEAVSALREAGLEARIQQVTSSESRGTVVDQTPSEGAEVADGSTVRLEVAKARPTVARIDVPDVVGSTAAAARSELRSAGLRVTTTAAVSQEPAGTVIEQSPRAGTQARKGATVRLTVSAGPATIDVPDVTGLDEAAARTELERAGFQVRVTDESIADPAQDGVVLRQTPPGGSSTEDGAVVTIVVGRLD